MKEFHLTDENVLLMGLLNKLTTLKNPIHFYWKIEHK